MATNPTTETLFAGFDCGGSRSRCLLVSRDPNQQISILGLGEGGPGNLRDVGPDGVSVVVRKAWCRAWEAAGRDSMPVRAAFCGIAGVSRPDQQGLVRDLISEIGIAEPSDIGVDHDIRIALAGALCGGPGIVAIAGTGSACYGRSTDGRTWRAGGFGSFLDDGGSAFDLGRAALTACGRSEDRRGPKTSLSESILQHLRLDDWPALLNWAGTHQDDRPAIGKIAPLVTQAASEGDDVAIQLIDSGTAELAISVATVARELKLSAPRVSATGGLAQASELWRSSFASAVHKHLGQAEIVKPLLDPVYGAAILAIQAHGIQLEADAHLAWARPNAQTTPDRRSIG